MDLLDDAARARIDKALEHWRQGDCIVDPQWFIFRTGPEQPLPVAGTEVTSESPDAAEAEVLGLTVLTQTCDIVRSCAERPFVEVSPLVEVDESILHEVERGHRPRYAFIPGLASRCWVADLDRTMTVEKSVVAGWDRHQGCFDDADVRRLASALARKRARMAFPDDFDQFASSLMDRASSKHAKESTEGEALRALREIRVRAAPSWAEGEVHLTFLFIPDEEKGPIPPEEWDSLTDRWLELVPPQGRFVEVDGIIQGLDDLTARDYVESDPLDLDHLSSREGDPGAPDP